jgi:hypothetical protein
VIINTRWNVVAKGGLVLPILSLYTQQDAFTQSKDFLYSFLLANTTSNEISSTERSFSLEVNGRTTVKICSTLIESEGSLPSSQNSTSDSEPGKSNQLLIHSISFVALEILENNLSRIM